MKSVYLTPLLLFVVLAGNAMPADTVQMPTAVMTPEHTDQNLIGHTSYYLDDTWQLTLTDVEQPQFADKFKPVKSDYPNFGYTKSAIWVKFTLSNQTVSDEEWILFIRENFLQVLNIYQVDEFGKSETLIQQGPNSVFSSRPTVYPELAVPIYLQSGSAATFYLQYWSGGESEISFSVITDKHMQEISAQLVAKNFIYYGMMIIFTLISLIALLVTRNIVFVAYAGYAFSALMYIMHADGNGFKYLWPNNPSFNGVASLVFGAGMIGFGALFAKLFLQTKLHHPAMDKALVALMTLVVTMLVSAVVLDMQMIKKAMVLLALIAILMFIFASLLAARKRFRQVRFFLLAWSGALISSALMTSRHWFGIEIPEPVQFDSIRIVMVSDAALMGLAIWDRISQLRKANEVSLEKNLRQAERNLRMNERLQELENRYRLAVDANLIKDKEIADTLHDLRQPLYALRLNIHAMIHGTNKQNGDAAQIENSFSYLEKLVDDQLLSSRTSEINKAQKTSVDLNELLHAVQKTYESDARERGLQLRVVSTSLTTKASAMVLRRILSNLVSNAIKYTPKGRVLIGCRRRGNSVSVEVHDTGVGMKGAQFEKALLRTARLEATLDEEGFGYGLSIVSQLCQRNGYALQIDLRRQSGTSLIVVI